VRAAEAGKDPDLLARYLEAWLLRLHGLYPPLDRCASCSTRLPDGALAYDRLARGFVCGACEPASGPPLPATVRDLIEALLSRGPAELTAAGGTDLRALEAFHRDLIAAHLERDLRSHRVLREVSREVGR
jgi:recombinational DNA repair protein (RecF pathway)